MQQGIQQYQTSQLRAALNSWEQALQIYRAIKNRHGEGWALGNLGIAYLSLGDYAKAIEYGEQQLTIAREIKNRQGEGTALGNLGAAYHSLGDYAKAIEYGEQYLTIAREIKDRLGEGTALGNLGAAYRSLGNDAKAIEYGQQSLAIAREIKDRKGEGTALGNLGLAYGSLGNYAKAIEYAQQHLAIAREIKDRLGEGTALGNLGAVYLYLGDYAKAIEYAQQHLAIARSIKDRKGESYALSKLGFAYSHISQYGRAIEYAQQALLIYRQMGDREGEVEMLNNLGVAYGSLSQDSKAIEFFQQALTIFRQMGIPIKKTSAVVHNLNRLATVYFNQALQHNQSNQYQAAIQLWEKALPIYRTIQDRNGELGTLGNLGNAYADLSQYDKAIAYYQQALTIARQVSNRNGEANTLSNLSNVYRSRSQPDKAIAYSQQALIIFRQLKVRGGEAMTLNRLGNAYISQSQYGKATEFYQQALVICRQLSDRECEAQTLNNLGSSYSSQSQYGEAIKFHQQALSMIRQVGNPKSEAVALGNLGNIYADLSQPDKALESYQQALKLYRQIGDRNGEANALLMLGNLLPHDKATALFQQALIIYRQIGDQRGEATALGSLGITYLFLLQSDKAIALFQQVLPIYRQIGDLNGEATTLENLGNTYYSLSQYVKAIEFYQQALPISRQIGDRKGEGTVLNNLGLVYSKIGDFANAEKPLFAAITIWESLRPGLTDESKVSFFDAQQARTYRTLQQVLVAQNKSILALEIAERGRARAFVDLLTQRLSSGSINPVIASAPNQEQIRQIAKAQNATLVQYSIIYEEFQIQAKSEPRESALYIWVIQPTGEITFREVDLKPLWQQQHNASLVSLIIDYQESIPVRSRSSLGSTKPEHNFNLRRLHQLLIDPIANLLPKDPNAHVIFIPQGSLFQVPFPALQDANDNYLIQKHTILSAPSIQVLALTRQQRQKRSSQPSNSGKALVLGNPTMPSVSLSPGEPKRQLSPLPGAEAEARAIAPLLNTQAIIGAQGTKAAIVQKMPQASIIHLATHGLPDNVRGLASAIALAPSGNDDGLLTAEEIFNMKLQANLVVLSACNTGEGRITGDGVIGLSRALISAGVPSVIVSLWRVPDAPTAELMQLFYQNLQNNPNKAQALRQAMLTTMKTHPQPRNWAAFTLIGEAE